MSMLLIECIIYVIYLITGLLLLLLLFLITKIIFITRMLHVSYLAFC